MKITDEMIDAASKVLHSVPTGEDRRIKDALKAALRVRKARKAEKCGAKGSVGGIDGTSIMYWRAAERKDLIPNGPTSATPKPTWDGKFEVGKSYRTRDGRKAGLLSKDGSPMYRLLGYVVNDDIEVSCSWTIAGFGILGKVTESDLIAPW